MAPRFLRELAGILATLNLRVNPAIVTVACEFPSVPGIVGTDGLPLVALLLLDRDATPLQRQLPFLLARTPAERDRILEDPPARQAPHPTENGGSLIRRTSMDLSISG